MDEPDFIAPEELLSVLFESPNATAFYEGEDIQIPSANAPMLKLWEKDRNLVGKSFAVAIPELIDQQFMAFCMKYSVREKHSRERYPFNPSGGWQVARISLRF